MSLSKKIKRLPFYWTIKLFLKRISGQELWLRPERKLDTASSDDWSFCKTLLSEDSIVYSLGVGDSIAFDLGLIANFNLKVYAFDPTPDSVNWVNSQTLPEQFEFHQWAVSGTDGHLRMVKRISKRGKKSKMIWTMMHAQTNDAESIEVPSFTIPSIMKKLNHDRIDLLKMDVEGAEYEIIDTLLDLPNKPKQLLVEFHHRFPGIGKNKTIDCIGKLRKAGYKIFSVSETGREVSFIQDH